MKQAMLCCEGPTCNGRSATDLEASMITQLPNVTAEMRDEAEKFARGAITKQLAVTPHTFAGVTFRAMTLFQRFECDVCGWSRIYGNGSA